MYKYIYDLDTGIGAWEEAEEGMRTDPGKVYRGVKEGTWAIYFPEASETNEKEAIRAMFERMRKIYIENKHKMQKMAGRYRRICELYYQAEVPEWAE